MNHTRRDDDRPTPIDRTGPQRTFDTEHYFEEGDAVIFDPENDSAWLCSTLSVTTEEAR